MNELPADLTAIMRMPSSLPGAQRPGVQPPTPGQNATGQPMSPAMLQQQLNQFVTQHPDQVAQIQQVMLEAMQTGELTAQELNMLVQLATVAVQNPAIYPQVRQFAIQQGVATEEDIPAQYDQSLLFLVLLAAKALQRGQGGQNMMQGGTPATMGVQG